MRLATLLLCGGCASALDANLGPVDAEPPPDAATSPPPDASAPAEPPKSAASITAAEAEAAGLPPLEIVLRAIPHGMRLSRRLEKRTYVTLSDTSAAPFEIELLAYGPAGPGDLPRLIEEARGDRPRFAVGPGASIMVAGADRYARAFSAGSGLTAVHGCAVMVPSLADGERGALMLVTVPARADSPSCELVISRPSLDVILDGLTLR